MSEFVDCFEAADVRRRQVAAHFAEWIGSNSIQRDSDRRSGLIGLLALRLLLILPGLVQCNLYILHNADGGILDIRKKSQQCDVC